MSGPKFFAVVAVIAFVAAGSAVLLVRRLAPPAKPPLSTRGPAQPNNPDEFVSDLSIPPFRLVDQDGKEVTEKLLLGRATVIDFVFTNCPFICPTLTATMSGLADKLAGTGVRFASFSVDPQRDTPERLREYAHANGIDLSRWTFITGDKSVIWGILGDGLKWAIEERPEQEIKLPDGSKMSNIRHPGWFGLVGPDGRLVTICTDIQDQGELDRFTERARALAATVPAK